MRLVEPTQSAFSIFLSRAREREAGALDLPPVLRHLPPHEQKAELASLAEEVFEAA